MVKPTLFVMGVPRWVPPALLVVSVGFTWGCIRVSERVWGFGGFWAGDFVLNSAERFSWGF